MKKILGLLAMVVVLACGVAAFLWSGTYNVAANVPHWTITHWFLEQVKDRSISAHSKGITVPPLKEPKLLERGFNHYHPMCRLCHGAPGFDRNEFAKGLYPSTPDLTSGNVQREWNDAELYWIIKNGLKLTGMPAFGVTHGNDELWGMVAFLRDLPNLQAKEYVAMVDAAEEHQGEKSLDHHHDHTHD
jgi:mono/diheme cytochrome c family protein